MSERVRRAALTLLLGTLIAQQQIPVHACPGCVSMGKSFADDVSDADVVLFGTLSEARIGASRSSPGTTHLDVKVVIKPHSLLENRTGLVLSRFVAAAEHKPSDFLVFGEVVGGEIDPFRIVAVDDRQLVDYIKKAAHLAGRPMCERLARLFTYLDHPISAISCDAYKVFANASYREVRSARKHYNRKLICQWIQDRQGPAHRLGLMGMLLGVAGKSDDAALLRKTIDEAADMGDLSGLTGLMNGYCLLDPESATPFVLEVFNDSGRPFATRFAALKCLRFVLDAVGDVPKESVFSGLKRSLSDDGVADLVIEELRQRRYWSAAPAVLKLKTTQPLVERAMLRFALEAPAPLAKEYVASRRINNPRAVRAAQASLRNEKQNLP